MLRSRRAEALPLATAGADVEAESRHRLVVLEKELLRDHLGKEGRSWHGGGQQGK